MTSATIKLFLPHGDAKGLRTAEISNWTGQALAAPRTELDHLLAREECDNAGVYCNTRLNPTVGEIWSSVVDEIPSCLLSYASGSRIDPRRESHPDDRACDASTARRIRD
jgi:hypothetical protein